MTNAIDDRRVTSEGSHGGGFFAALGRFVVRNPWKVIAAWIIVAVAVVATAPALPTTSSESSFLPSSYESIRAIALQDRAFPQAGHVSANAAIIVFSRPDSGPLMPGVGAVGQHFVSKDGATAAYSVVLNDDPQSTTAVNVVRDQLRPAAHAAAPAGTYALVGGTTAVFADIQTAVGHDYAVVFPVAAVIILLILMLLLRSLVAPWYLILAVGLGFAATLGARSWCSRRSPGRPGWCSCCRFTCTCSWSRWAPTTTS